MALGYNFLGPSGEQVFSTSPQISDILARYFGTPAPSATGTTPASTGGTGSTNTVGGSSLARPLGSDLGARGSGFGSDNGIAGEATSFADRNTAVNPSLMGSLALAGSIIPGGIGLPLGGPLASLALQALGIDTSGIVGNLGTALGIGSSPFNVAGPSLTADQVQGIINSVSSLPASTPRVVVMNALNDALAKARASAQIASNTGAGTTAGGIQPGNAPATGGVDLAGLASRMGGTPASAGLAGSGVGGGARPGNYGGSVTGGIAGGYNAAGNRGPQGAASGGNDGGGAMAGGGPEGAGGGPSLSGGR